MKLEVVRGLSIRQKLNGDPVLLTLLAAESKDQPPTRAVREST